MSGPMPGGLRAVSMVVGSQSGSKASGKRTRLYRCLQGHSVQLSRGDLDGSYPKTGYAKCPQCADQVGRAVRKRVLREDAFNSKYGGEEESR